MKRLLLIASVAILAAGCQKTFVDNEVQTPIGFSTEVGKQTRAIAQDSGTASAEYFNNQPFGVFAYGYKGDTRNNARVMDHVEIAKTGNKWIASDGFTYYWPNDPTTTLHFYAYSPVSSAKSNQKDGTTENLTIANHQFMPVLVEHTVDGGYTFSNYEHDNKYRDFMISDPVKGATYSNPDGNETTTTASGKEGEVPLKFNHEMTQIVFKVTTDEAYPGVTFTVEEITLKNFVQTASYTSQPATDAKKWTPKADAPLGQFTVFPANTALGAVSSNDMLAATDNAETTDIDETTVEAPIELNNDNIAAGASTYATMITTGVTMIPQDIATSSITPTAGVDSYKDDTAQMFMIKYSIAGDRVAEETVTKHVPFEAINTTAIDWKENKKITYVVKIGLNQISFAPEVVAWSDDIDDNQTTGDEIIVPVSPTVPTQGN